MSTTKVPGFAEIPKDLLDAPKLRHISPEQLARVLGQLIAGGLIQAEQRPDGLVGYRPTARGLRLLGKLQ